MVVSKVTRNGRRGLGWARVGMLVGACVLLASAPVAADEGQWMPKQIAELDQAELSRLGLKLSAAEIWNPDDFGLMAAIVNFGGCSSGFVSSQGLIATNHHCAYGAIQALSSVDHDYLTDGFYAPTLADEKRAKGKTIKVLQKITDVTQRMHEAIEGLDDPLARQRAWDIASKQIVAECEDAGEHLSCRVAAFYHGSEVQLHEYLELEDVRLVYAPPAGIGNYGGEVDNWMWPRHTGDYSLLRAYVGPDGKPAEYSEDNVPYQPRRHLEVGAEGVEPGSFVAVLGFPGTTDRYMPASEMRRQTEQFLPRRVDLYGEWIRILEEESVRDPAVKIKVAATLKSLANRHKNARGMLEGIRRDGLLERREAEDKQLAAWAKEHEGYDDVLPGLTQLAAARRATFERDFLLDNAKSGARSLATAIDVVRWARERRKPDLERVDTYMDRGEKRLWSRIEGRISDYDETVDTRLMQEYFRRVEALPPALRFSGLKAGDVAPWLARSRINDTAFVEGLFQRADAEEIAAQKDPMIALAREIVSAMEKQDEEGDRREGSMRGLGPRYFEMVKGVRQGPVYPDANGTLRFSYATVKGYAPRDGLVATPQTSLAGQLAKNRGAEPFDLPTKVVEMASAAKQTYWSDPGLGDVPVCFLATGDTTGGNSGSPMVDGKGRWIGLNFDRVWENIAGDFGYDMKRSRNVGVDVRYLLWSLDAVVGADRLLAEMGVADKRGAGPRPIVTANVTADVDATPSGDGAELGTPLAAAGQAPTGAPAGTTDPGCGCSEGPQRFGAWLALPFLLLVRRRL